MPPSEVVLSPSLLLAMWAGGMALGAAFVARWRIVGPGYFWTAGGAALLAGGFAAFGGPWAAVATGFLIVGVGLAKRPAPASLAFATSAVLYLVQAAPAVGWIMAITGALALGGTTCEMILGHWYLVDPTMPKWALRRLDGAGILGLTADTGMAVAFGAMAGGASFVLTWSFLGLSGLAILLMVGVWFALKESGYEGVMAATGLSYLAVLTALGSVALARMLLST